MEKMQKVPLAKKIHEKDFKNACNPRRNELSLRMFVDAWS
jgi:hypothetical protein